MARNNLTSMRGKSNTLSNRGQHLLEEIAKRPVTITRTEAKDFCRVILGSASLRDLPSGKGRRVFRLPNSDDALILDYHKRAALFEPSWVKCRVYSGAWQPVLRPTLPLELLVSRWLEPVLRLLRISGSGGISHAA